jgi:hypothetical protein
MTTMTQSAEILNNLLKLLAAHQSAFKQKRIYKRVQALVLAEILTLGRHTVTQLLMGLGQSKGDWTAWYRLFSQGRINEEHLTDILLDECLRHFDEDKLLVLGGDGTQTPRTSGKMEGVGYGVNHQTPPFKRGIHLTQRWFHGALFLPAEEGFTRALPLRFLPAFTERSKRTVSKAQTEGQAAHRFLQETRAKLVERGREQQPILFLADGGYDNVDFWKGLPEGVHALVRTAKNRTLRYLPSADDHRNRKYGEFAPKPQQFWQERGGWCSCSLELRGKKRKLRYRVEGPFLRERAPKQPLFLLVVGGQSYHKNGKEKHRQPVPYLINAKLVDGQWVLPFDPKTLLFWAWQRWELEVAHRELKSNLGLGEKQAWQARAAICSVQWSAWVYALLNLAGYRTWQFTHHPRDQTAWWPGGKRWSFNTLLRHFRAALGAGQPFLASWLTFPNDRPEKFAEWLNLGNLISGSSRL